MPRFFHRRWVRKSAASLLVGLPLLPGAPVFDEGAYADMDEECIHYSNEELLEVLKTDENEEELHNIALKDASLHRMTKPVEAHSVELSKVAIRPSAACALSMLASRY